MSAYAGLDSRSNIRLVFLLEKDVGEPCCRLKIRRCQSEGNLASERKGAYNVFESATSSQDERFLLSV